MIVGFRAYIMANGMMLMLVAATTVAHWLR